MEPFTSLTAVTALLLRDNIDTDTIIPSREMRTVSKKGLADGLFAGWRYKSISGRDPDLSFVLNDPVRANARILVTGANFGCGSSREHAVWALREYGFRAVIAVSFNPIFRSNCIANGVVPVTLVRAEIEEIAALLDAEPAADLTVDLVDQTVTRGDRRWFFSIEPEARHLLLSGLDPIRQTLQLEARISAFRAADKQRRPWIYSGICREGAVGGN